MKVQSHLKAANPEASFPEYSCSNSANSFPVEGCLCTFTLSSANASACAHLNQTNGQDRQETRVAGILYALLYIIINGNHI